MPGTAYIGWRYDIKKNKLGGVVTETCEDALPLVTMGD